LFAAEKRSKISEKEEEQSSILFNQMSRKEPPIF
jgi:hypothetical protein